MAKQTSQETQPAVDKAFLIGVEIYLHEGILPIEDSLDELRLLAETAGIDVVGRVVQKLNHPNPKTYIGSGKVEEISALVDDKQADVIIFDDELSPRHQRELEVAFGEKVRVLDRTALILDIFAQHANTREGALQVELAQYEYRLPRLTRAWTHLARQAGGGGGRAGAGVGLRGPGETQLEVDRRDIRRRIDKLKVEIEKIRAHRQRHRIRRKRSRMPIIALVGYTNAGKSTLLNQLANANIYVADKLFATLDPTTRRIEMPSGNPVLVTDTVGFIQKLPTTLVAAFRATLEEISEANLLIHVLDIYNVNAQAQAEAVYQTLQEIGANHIPMLTAMNKIDLLSDPQNASRSLDSFEDAVAISASLGIGISDLLDKVEDQLFSSFTNIDVFLPYVNGDLISLFHDQGRIDRIEHLADGVMINGKIPVRLVSQFRDVQNLNGNSQLE